MNGKAFLAMLARDVRVARRNFIPLLLQTFLQPLIFVFIFGRVMVGSGYMPAQYKSLLVPGILAISMFASGIWAVAMPLIAEFQISREIEDRLLAPMKISWVAVEKVVFGAMQALAAGIVVIPASWILLRPGVEFSFHRPLVFVGVALLVALFSASAGLVIGCTIEPPQTGLLFSLIISPMVFFGCAYYPWHALDAFPILQKAVLVNPLVYASEGLRAALAPQFPHLPLSIAFAALIAFDTLLFAVGLRQFQKKAVN